MLVQGFSQVVEFVITGVLEFLIQIGSMSALKPLSSLLWGLLISEVRNVLWKSRTLYEKAGFYIGTRA